MHFSELKDYIINNNPLGLDNALLPVITAKDDDSMTEEIVNELSKQIEESIKELEDLQEIFTEIESIKPELNKNLNEFEVDLNIISDTKKIVDKWNNLITEQKAMARKFINKYSGRKIKTDTFDKIKEKLT